MPGCHSPIEVNRKIVEFIDNGQPFAVALILKADGSTPRDAGVKAVIDETGKIWGTVGGGMVEADAQRLGVEACQSNRPVVFDLELDNTYPGGNTPICGGVMRILIDPTAAKDRNSYAQAAQALAQRERGILITRVRVAGETSVDVQWFPEENISSYTDFPGGEAIHRCLAKETPQLFVETSADESLEVMVEPVIPKPMLLIVGGGHVGQAVARQAILVGFDVTVLDDRSEFTQPALFPEGTRSLCGDIGEEVAGFPIGDDTSIVIVTRGHKHDADALAACIHSPAAYIGMIGSRRKVDLVRENFTETGLGTKEEFDRV